MGKNYFGYQIQPREISVQEVLETSLSTLLREKISITGAGRTDTGVHAKKIFAHFDVAERIPSDLVRRLNRFLPKDIGVERLFEVQPSAHARFDATYRTYQYHVSLVKDPFSIDTAYSYYTRELDVEKMNQAAEIICEYKEFESFAKVGGDNKTFVCQIYKAKWEQIDEQLIFTISANRFLRNMVRAIVGTLLEVGVGKIKPEEVREIIDSKNRNKAGTSAPAHGLYLVDVGYEWESILKKD